MIFKGFLVLLGMMAFISLPVIICIILQSEFDHESKYDAGWFQLRHDDTITLDDDVIEFLEAMEGDDD